MFVVREVFTAKPGMASRLARLFKDLSDSMPDIEFRVMTDHIGPFNTVVLEWDVSDLTEFERQMAEYASRADIRERMAGYTDMYLTGAREIYRVV